MIPGLTGSLKPLASLNTESGETATDAISCGWSGVVEAAFVRKGLARYERIGTHSASSTPARLTPDGNRRSQNDALTGGLRSVARTQPSCRIHGSGGVKE